MAPEVTFRMMMVDTSLFLRVRPEIKEWEGGSDGKALYKISI